MQATDASSFLLAPSGGNPSQRLAATGMAESVNSEPLPIGSLATLWVGAAAVRISFHDSGSFGSTATTDLRVAEGRCFRWTVTASSAYVRIEAADGVAAYEAWVWKSSPKFA